MSIGKWLKCLFAKNGNPDHEIKKAIPAGNAEGLHLNARVADAFGAKGVITHIDPNAEHGLGIVRVQYDDGRNASFALAASGLRIISEN